MASARKTLRGEPLPDWVPPQLTRLVTAAPEGDGWAHEIKYDGYRMQARLDRGRVRLLTRTGLDWTDKYPATAAALAGLPVRQAYLDGELCGVRPDGTTAFGLIQAATDRAAAASLVYFAFDILHRDGVDLRQEPLAARKAALEPLFAGAPPVLQYGSHVVGAGARFHAEACRLRLEGVVSKRLDAPYAPGDRGLWVKTKCLNREEFVVVGWTDPEGARPRLGALLLGYHAPDGALVYAGRAGSGMTDAELERVWRRLQPLAADRMPLDEPPPRGSRFGTKLVLSRVHWLRPELVVEVSYLTWTDDGLLRQVVYRGLREDKPARDVVRARPGASLSVAPPPTASPPKRPRGRPTGAVPPENVLQLLPDAVSPEPDALRAYWTRVAARALPHLARRPLKLVRHVRHTVFYHRGPLPPLPPAVHALRIARAQGGEGVRVWIEDLDGLLGLVEIGVVELHPWGARVDDIERPDRLVIDLDPGAGVPWDFVIETALGLRAMLADEGYACWPKTTGGKGLHLMVPVSERMGWQAAHALARGWVRRFEGRAPDRFTTTAALASRPGRLFLDYLRNGRGTTAVGAFSPRARPGFPIAAPVSWAAVARGVRPDAYAMDRLPPARGVARD